ncbi:solute carrier family 22 member 4-like [Elysia marginata]|uniref:Solute carrier family 22 member 4-like n=1 Tax=Elysia marginata TaxID=1093978 RepID=A0AAV4J7M8_9GAST|nr:solute carrier family 22 member 4-like [Elysia marginata]
MIVPYSTEFYPIKWRHIIPPVPMWPLGVCAFAMGAWLLEDWVDLHLACAALGIPGLLGYFYIPESPRWLATQGREHEAYAALKKMATVNGKELPSTAEETIKVGQLSRYFCWLITDSYRKCGAASAILIGKCCIT